MKHLFTLFAALGITLTTLAQSSTGTISGKLLEENGNPAAFVTMMLLDVDSIMVKADFSKDDGSFTFLNITPGVYKVQVSSIQYSGYSSEDFSLSDGELKKLPEILLTTAVNELDEVKIMASKPMFEIQPDKTVFNVESSPNASGSDGIELLRKSPGVIIDNNDNIILQGKNGVRIFIDGKPTQLSGEDLTAMLRGMQSDQIESIEIITNPSAKYEAEGNAGIINIVLKRDKNLGTNATITAGYNGGLGIKDLSDASVYRDRMNGSINLNHREKKVSLFGSYNYFDGSGWNLQDINREQNGGYYDQGGDRQWSSLNHGYRAGADYFINKNHTIGFVTNGNLSEGTWDSDSRTIFGDAATRTPYSILEANNNRNRNTNSANGNLNYQYKGNKGASLNVDLDYGYYFNKAYMFQPNEFMNPTTGLQDSASYFDNNQNTQIDIKTIKIDYDKPLGKGKISFGGKYSNVFTQNAFVQDSLVLNESKQVVSRHLDVNNSNDFDYNEQVSALYASYFGKFSDKFSMNVGIRMENTSSTGTLESYIGAQDNYKVSRNYTDFFPSGGVTYALSKDNQFGINYSRRIDRPNYQNLNPFRFQLDKYTYQEGNPWLNPQYSNNIEVTHTLKSTLTTKVSYGITNEFFSQVLEKGEDKNSTLLKQRNLGKVENYSVNISAPYNITKWWSTYSSLSVNRAVNNSVLPSSERLKVDVTTLNFYMQNNFMLPKGFKFEVSGWYNSPSVWGGTFLTSEMYSVNLGLKKSLLEGKASVTLGVNDILYSQKWTGNSNYQGVKLDIAGRGDSRRFKVGFTYSLGNQNVKSRRRKTGLEDEKNRISSDNG